MSGPRVIIAFPLILLSTNQSEIKAAFTMSISSDCGNCTCKLGEFGLIKLLCFACSCFPYSATFSCFVMHEEDPQCLGRNCPCSMEATLRGDRNMRVTSPLFSLETENARIYHSKSSTLSFRWQNYRAETLHWSAQLDPVLLVAPQDPPRLPPPGVLGPGMNRCHPWTSLA